MSETFIHGHALVVGAGADLPNTVDDAIGLASILCDPERCAYPAEQVKRLTGPAAGRDAILKALEELATLTDPEATVVVYFSGHGYTVTTAIGEAYFLMPFGYDVSQLYKTAVSGKELTDRLAAIPARRLLLLLDCCHAGGIEESKTPGVQLAKTPLPPEAERLFTQGSGRVVIASSKAGELSYAGKPYSAFTLALIEALAGVGAARQDGYVRVADLALYAREMVPKRTQQRQHPVLTFEQADNFVLAYYAGGDTQPKALPFAQTPEIEAEPGALAGAQRPSVIVNTGGGAYIAGNVKTGGGAFVGRDKIVYGDEVHGDKVQGNKIVIDRAPTAREQPPGATGSAYPNRTTGLSTHGEAERLRQELAGLQANYDRVTKRIEAVDLEISRALDSLSKQVWEEKRAELVADRVSLVEAMRRIELQLNG